MRNTYSNPVIEIEKFDYENILTTSGVTDAVSQAQAGLEALEVSTANILIMK